VSLINREWYFTISTNNNTPRKSSLWVGETLALTLIVPICEGISKQTLDISQKPNWDISVSRVWLLKSERWQVYFVEGMKGASYLVQILINSARYCIYSHNFWNYTYVFNYSIILLFWLSTLIFDHYEEDLW